MFQPQNYKRPPVWSSRLFGRTSSHSLRHFPELPRGRWRWQAHQWTCHHRYITSFQSNFQRHLVFICIFSEQSSFEDNIISTRGPPQKFQTLQWHCKVLCSSHTCKIAPKITFCQENLAWTSSWSNCILSRVQQLGWGTWLHGTLLEVVLSRLSSFEVVLSREPCLKWRPMRVDMTRWVGVIRTIFSTLTCLCLQLFATLFLLFSLVFNLITKQRWYLKEVDI